MKKIVILIIVSVLVISCGNSQKKSVDTIMASGDIEAIQQRRNEITDQLQGLNTEIKKLDKKLRK